jgi:LPS sulfotransferase NodH
MPAPDKIRLPDFIAVGPPRTATTWLHEVLKERVCLPAERKETDFFTRFYDRGAEWYADFFRHCGATSVVGELSPMYFASDEARERIAAMLPRCKIICSFREPVARAYSNYRLLRRQAFTKADFEAAATSRGDLVESSRYGSYLEKWFAAFGRERVMVLIYDDLEANPQGFLDSVCDFIGIERFAVTASTVGTERVHQVNTLPANPRMARAARNLVAWFANRRMDRAAGIVRRNRLIKYMLEGGDPFPPPAPEMVARLRERYRPEMEKLERLIGRDLSAWKNGGENPARRPAARS